MEILQFSVVGQVMITARRLLYLKELNYGIGLVNQFAGTAE